MTKYLISFPSAAMVFPDEDLQAVSDASHAVVQEAKIAVACRCAQEVRAFGYDPAS